MRLYYGPVYVDIIVDGTADVIKAARELITAHTPNICVDKLPLGCKIGARVLHGGVQQVGKRLSVGAGAGGGLVGDGHISAASYSPSFAKRAAQLGLYSGMLLSSSSNDGTAGSEDGGGGGGAANASTSSPYSYKTYSSSTHVVSPSLRQRRPSASAAAASSSSIVTSTSDESAPTQPQQHHLPPLTNMNKSTAATSIDAQPLDTSTCQLLLSSNYQKPSLIVTFRSVLEVVLVRFEMGVGFEIFLREDLEFIGGGITASSTNKAANNHNHHNHSHNHHASSMMMTMGGSDNNNDTMMAASDVSVAMAMASGSGLSAIRSIAPPTSLTMSHGDQFSKASVFSSRHHHHHGSNNNNGKNDIEGNSNNQYQHHGYQTTFVQRHRAPPTTNSSSSSPAATRAVRGGGGDFGAAISLFGSSSPSSPTRNERDMTASAAPRVATYTSDFIDDEAEVKRLIERNYSLQRLLVESGALINVTLSLSSSPLPPLNPPLNVSGSADASAWLNSAPITPTKTAAAAANNSLSAKNKMVKDGERRGERDECDDTFSVEPSASALIRSTSASASPLAVAAASPPLINSNEFIHHDEIKDNQRRYSLTQSNDIDTKGFVSILCEFNPPVVTIVGSIDDAITAALQAAIFDKCVAPTAQAHYYEERYAFGNASATVSRYERYLAQIEADKAANGRGGRGEGAQQHEEKDTLNATPAKGSANVAGKSSSSSMMSSPSRQTYSAASANKPQFVDIAVDRTLRVQRLSLPHHFFNDVQQSMLYVVIMDVMEEAAKRGIGRGRAEARRLQLQQQEAEQHHNAMTTMHSSNRRSLQNHHNALSSSSYSRHSPCSEDSLRLLGSSTTASNKHETDALHQSSPLLSSSQGAPRPFYYKMVPFDGETSVLHNIIKQAERNNARAMRGPQGRFVDAELTTLEPYKHSCELLFIPTPL